MTFRTIGLDIGHRMVRAVALERTRSGWRIAGSASVPRRDSDGTVRPLSAVVDELDALVRFARAPVSVADSSHSVLVRFVPTIPMPPERLAKLLRLELSQHVDQDGELAGDSFPVPLDGDEVIHACALGHPVELHAWLAELARAGVTPKRIQVGAAALFNATLPAPPVAGEELALLVDIGEATTRVALIGEGRLLAFRQLTTGGQAFTDALATSRGLEPAKAEELKLHWGMAQAVQAEPAEAELRFTEVDQHAFAASEPGFDAMLDQGVDEPGPQTVQLAGTTLGAEMTRAAESLHLQLFNTLSWFRAQLQNDKLVPSRVFLCGGGAALAGLGPYLARRLDLPVQRFDPTAGLEGNVPDKAHELVGAIGLALSEHAEGIRLDLLPESVVQRRLWRERLMWPYVAAGALVVATVVYLAGQWNNHLIHQKDADAAASLKGEAKAHYDTFTELKQERERLGEDLNTIVSRLTFNRDFLYVVRLLKVRAPEYQDLWLTKLSAVLVEDQAKPLTNAPRLGARRGEKGGSEIRLPRGNLEIEGRFAFERGSDSESLNRDFRRYLAALESATTPDGTGGAVALFDPKLTTVTDKDELAARVAMEKKDDKIRQDKAVFPFEFMLRFSPIRLQEATLPNQATKVRP